jgi:2-polyprenyl-3-methyl-5-hydroxy-6-metoxy-1,4-benzoquinol methylase
MGLKKCLACQSTDTENLFTASRFSYLRCKNCDLVFLSNAPSDSYFKRFYAYQKGANREIRKTNPALLTYLKIPFIKNAISTWTRFINISRATSVKNFTKGNRILDIGCGAGDFLSEMNKSGWDAYGLELGDNLVELAERKVGKGKIFQGYLDKTDFRRAKFDIITIWQVLEHISDLKKTFLKINGILSDKGVLVIEVPHAKSLNLAIFKKNWTLLIPPQHLHLWSKRSFEKLLNNYHLIIKKIEYPVDFPFIFFSSLSKKNRRAIYFFPLLLPLSVILAKIFSILDRGDIVRIYATKK